MAGRGAGVHAGDAPKPLQDMFESIVRENVDSFDMSFEEAVADALEQMRAMGVDVTRLDTRLRPADAEPLPAEQAARELAAMDADSAAREAERIVRVAIESDDARAFFAKAGGVARMYELALPVPPALRSGAQASAHAFPRAPLVLAARDLVKDDQRASDAVEDAQLEALLMWLETGADDGESADALGERNAALIALLRELLIRNERNRQRAVGAGLIARMCPLFERFAHESAVLRGLCVVARVLTFNDDERALAGKGHEHAMKMVEAGVLDLLLRMVPERDGDALVLRELLASLSKLCAKDEHCLQMREGGVLDTSLRLLGEHADDESVCVSAVSLLRSLAGNDACKVDIASGAVLESVIRVHERHRASVKVTEQVSGLLAAITLRHPQHARIVVANGGVPLLLDILRNSVQQTRVARQALLAIRNMCVRSQEVRTAFLDEKTESLCRPLVNIPELRDNARAVLRDLGLEY